VSLTALLQSLRPVLNPGVFAFCSLPAGNEAALPSCLGVFHEAEGTTVIIDEEEAVRRGWPVLFRAAWLTLTVHSELEAVGLTAAVAGALTDAGISCNVVAAVNHDHLFVPAASGESALRVLLKLQQDARA